MSEELEVTAEDECVLRARAAALSRLREVAPANFSTVEVLEFRLARERYAVETHFVREVLPLGDLTPLPCTPPFLLGVVNVRGQILPVIDFRKFFGLPEQGLADLHHLAVVHGRDFELGLLVDLVVGTKTMDVAALQPPSPALNAVDGRYLKGITADCLVLLDLKVLLSDPGLIVHEKVDT